ncbi:MAG: hypothetical protein FWC55_02805 [Firmicutes bacterium]|nr:hypothetical protein [Bacillota bacterium]
MTAREIVKKRLDHEGTDVTPFTIAFEGGLYQRLTEYYKDGDWQAKKLRQFMCGYLNADTMMWRPIDDVYSTDGLGSLWRMDKKPWHLQKPVLPEPTMKGYDFPGPEKFVENTLAHKKEAVARYEADGEHYRCINMGWGIFEHSWIARGFENALTDMALEGDFYAELTSRLTDIYIEMLKACADVPADAYLFGDDWGDQRGVIMGAETWRKFIKPCQARIYAEVHRQGKKALQHSCGSISEIYDDLIEIGMDCHESVQPEAHNMAPEYIKPRWGKKLSFWGCLGSQSVLTHGSCAEIRAEILRLAELFREDGGYILAPAKELFDEMPTEKAVTVVETLAELNG